MTTEGRLHSKVIFMASRPILWSATAEC